MAALSRGRRALAALGFLSIAAVALAALGTYALFNVGQPAASATATGSRSSIPSAEPSPSPSGPVVTAGIASIELSSGKTRDRASVPLTCTYADRYSPTVTMVPTTLALFGESVTVSWEPGAADGGLLVLSRAGAARYVGQFDLNHNFEVRFFELRLDTADPAPAVPLVASGGTATITASFDSKCDWLPTPEPGTSPEDPSFMTRGSATIAIEGAGAASVTTPIDCHWVSKTSVGFYAFVVRVELAGERVELSIVEFAPSPGDSTSSISPGLRIVREGLVADYTGRREAFEAQGWGAPTGTLRFHQLALDSDAYLYPRGVPLPTPMDWFMRPLGGLEANRTLSGSLAWNCGEAPAGVPEIEPTPGPTEPPSDHGRPFPWPDVSVRDTGQAKASAAELIICASGVEFHDPTAYLPWGCEWPDGRWYVPYSTIEARAGTTLAWSVPGWKITSPELAYASPAEVERWRSGEPDTTVVLMPVSTSRSSAAFAAPPAGDWVVIFSFGGTNSAGDKLTANYTIRIHVTA